MKINKIFLIVGIILLLIFMQQTKETKKGAGMQIGNTIENGIITNVYNDYWTDQRFITNDAFTMNEVKFMIQKDNFPYNIYVELWDDNTGTLIVSNEIFLSSYDNTKQVVSIPLSANLSASTGYRISMGSWSTPPDRVSFYGSDTDVYSGGFMGINWTNQPTKDLYFEIWGDTINCIEYLDTGYDYLTYGYIFDVVGQEELHDQCLDGFNLEEYRCDGNAVESVTKDCRDYGASWICENLVQGSNGRCIESITTTTISTTTTTTIATTTTIPSSCPIVCGDNIITWNEFIEVGNYWVNS